MPYLVRNRNATVKHKTAQQILTRVTVVLDQETLDWLNSQTTRTRNRSMVVRDLVYAEMDDA